MGTTTVCAHHWVIEPANGPTSKGRCRRCREERDFQNATPAGSAVWGTTDSVLKRSLSRY